MQEPIFRDARITDVGQLVELRVRMLCEANQLAEDPSTPEFRKISEEYFRDAIPSETYVGAVAEVDGELVSSNGLVLYCKPPSFVSNTGIVGYVTNVYTVPQFRRRGIATQLLKNIILKAKASGASKLHLGTTDDGQDLYRGVGFTDVAFAALELRL